MHTVGHCPEIRIHQWQNIGYYIGKNRRLRLYQYVEEVFRSQWENNRNSRFTRITRRLA